MKLICVSAALLLLLVLGQAPQTNNTAGNNTQPAPIPSPSPSPSASASTKPRPANNQTQINNPAQQNGRQQNNRPPNAGQRPNNAGNRPAAPKPQYDIYTLVSRSSVHKVLTSLIQYANMTDAIKGLRDTTFFAPTDEGFHLTLRDLRYKREGDPTAVSEFWQLLLEDQKALINVRTLLLYHALAGRRTAAQLVPRGIRTSERRRRTKANLDVEFEADGLKDRAVALPNPNYTRPRNVVATNGIIHSLDRVLIPVDINRKALAARTEALAEKFQPSNKKPVCFPASATVHTAAGGRLRMGDLAAGTAVRVSEHTHAAHSRVFLFSHRRTRGRYAFLRLTTASGHAITLAHAHYLYANGRLATAAAVRVGDTLRTVAGPSQVTRIAEVVEHGLVAPHTLHGDLLVDGVVASSYTQAVHPRLAQVLLAPLRAAVRLGLAREPLGALLYDGADRLAPYLPRGPAKY